MKEELVNELNPNIFFRVNRKTTAHIDSIDRIVNYFNFRLKLTKYPETNIVISRDRTTQLKEGLNQQKISERYADGTLLRHLRTLSSIYLKL